MGITKAVAANPQGDTTVYDATRSVAVGTAQLPAGSVPNSITASASWSIPTIAAGANSTKVVTLSGLQVGDYIEVTVAPGTSAPAGVAVTGYVSAADTVTLSAHNNGGSTSVAATVTVTVTGWSAGLISAEEALALKGR